MAVRYDRLVRSVVLVVLAVGIAPAALAKPALLDLDTFEEPVEPCARGKTWKRVRTCLDKQSTVSVLHDTETVKIVGLTPRGGRGSRLVLYAQRDASWVRSTTFATLNDSTELLGITAFQTPTGPGLRVDVGHSVKTSVSMDQATSTRSVLRRIHSTVCSPSDWNCRTLMTACDAFVRGRSYFTFRAELVWHATLGVRLRGDIRNAGTVCRPPQSLLLPPETE